MCETQLIHLRGNVSEGSKCRVSYRAAVQNCVCLAQGHFTNPVRLHWACVFITNWLHDWLSSCKLDLIQHSCLFNTLYWLQRPLCDCQSCLAWFTHSCDSQGKSKTLTRVQQSDSSGTFQPAPQPTKDPPLEPFNLSSSENAWLWSQSHPEVLTPTLDFELVLDKGTVKLLWREGWGD